MQFSIAFSDLPVFTSPYFSYPYTLTTIFILLIKAVHISSTPTSYYYLVFRGVSTNILVLFFFFFSLLFLNWFNSQMVHEFPVYLTLVLCSKVLKFWVFFKGRQWKETLNLLLLCNLYHQLHFLSKLNLGPKQKNQLININPLCVQELLNHPLSTPSYPLIRNLLSVIPKFVGFGYSCSFNH